MRRHRCLAEPAGLNGTIAQARAGPGHVGILGIEVPDGNLRLIALSPAFRQRLDPSVTRHL
jgi:NAD(P)H-dependent flavin oxidoreductase YrpB (nitropropane dioxygenase family)